MVKTEEHTPDTPTKKESYFGAEVKIRCHIAVAKEIRVRLRPGSARSELFRGTCFGPWLDVRSTSNESNLVHLILQTQYIPAGLHNALFFRVGGRELRFGPEEFCLITGLRFMPHRWRQKRPDINFRGRVFGHVQASIKVSDLKNVFDNSLDRLLDADAVRLCLLMLLELGFMGRESKSVVDPALLDLVDDLESWNSYPWGSYVWKVVYGQLHNALAERSARVTSIWIFEVFPYARKFAVKRGGIPRAISWDENQRITWELALPFVLDATVPGFEPLQVLTPTPAESATDWWRASRQFLESSANDYSPPSKKKARLTFQPRSSDKAHNQLVDDIATTTTTTTLPVEDIADTTTLPSSDGTASYRTMDMEKEMMEIKLQKLLVMTRLTSLEERYELRCKYSQLFILNYTGKVSSQSDIICVQGYNVKKTVAPILESIFKKHGDIAADCVFKPASMRSSFLENVCEVSRIQTDDGIDSIEEMEQQVLATEAANIKVSWLRAHLDIIRKRKEASTKCSLLMETKVNTVLVKKAAQMDLRERCVELMSAQERFEEAERCVRVLHLVENNLNDSILESKGNIDSLASQPVL
ncbi:putative phospholipase [Helianthus annuus]|nr:putative phospholipase [Helianthus annuus]